MVSKIEYFPKPKEMSCQINDMKQYHLGSESLLLWHQLLRRDGCLKQLTVFTRVFSAWRPTIIWLWLSGLSVRCRTTPPLLMRGGPHHLRLSFGWPRFTHSIRGFPKVKGWHGFTHKNAGLPIPVGAARVHPQKCGIPQTIKTIQNADSPTRSAGSSTQQQHTTQKYGFTHSVRGILHRERSHSPLLMNVQ